MGVYFFDPSNLIKMHKEEGYYAEFCRKVKKGNQ